MEVVVMLNVDMLKVLVTTANLP